MRTVCLVFALFGLLAVSARADEPESAKEKPAAKLKAGDRAPTLKVSKWLQGKEVTEFKPDKIYVVEFWATWCGPCIVMMPHLAELQATYKDKGVTFIGFSAKDQNNTEEKVAAFVKKRGPKLGYTFAYADNRDTYDAWMKAAGQNGIPCSFVVDGNGRIAWIGHPMYLDVVLPKVLTGMFPPQKGKQEVDKIEKQVNDVFRALGGSDPEATLKKLTDFETNNPALTKIPYFIGPKLNLLIRAGKEAEARRMAEEVIKRATEQEDPTALRTVSASLRSAKDNKELLELSLKAAKATLQVAGDKDAFALFNMAETWLALGDKEKAREYGKKAVEAADSPNLKQYLEKRVKAFDDKTKEDKK